MPMLNRRSLLLSAASLGPMAALPLRAETLPPIHVAKGMGCECCTAWVDHLRTEGFTVTKDLTHAMKRLFRETLPRLFWVEVVVGLLIPAALMAFQSVRAIRIVQAIARFPT